jgi:hypothetical protein
MKTIINVGYNDIEFTKEEIDEIKSFVSQLKDYEIKMNLGFLFKGITFVIQVVGYDIMNKTKIITLQQITTKKNPIIQTPKSKLELVH